MPFTDQSESLTEQFYAWDYRLRGYDLWPYPVSPEPVFAPFEPRLSQAAVVDDTRRHTVLSRLAASVKAAFSDSTPASSASHQPEEPADELFVPDLYVPTGEIVEYQIALPAGVEYPPARFEQLLQNLKGLHSPISIELIGGAHQVVVQLSCRENDAAPLLQQLEALFPDAIITSERDYLERQLSASGEHSLAVDFGLEQSCLNSLTSASRQTVDPLATVIAALAACTEDEVLVLQFLIAPTKAPWAQALTQAIKLPDGSPLFAGAPELVKQAAEKTNQPLFGTVLRICAQSRDPERRESLLRQLGGALSQFNNDRVQGLIPLENDGYPDDIHLQDFIYRHTHRSGMLLNSSEVVAFGHLPQLSVTNPKLVRRSQKTKELPRIARGHDFPIGTNTHRGDSQTVTLSAEHRSRHSYVVGASGTGKSTLLLNMIRRDMAAGRGIALLDPHGDLVDDVLRQVPEHRLDDVVLLDPADEDYPIGLNILDARSDAEKTLLASDLVAVFRRLATSWGDQMNAVLANGIIAILEHEDGGTLMTLRRFLVDEAFRRDYLRSVLDDEVRFYWEKEYSLLRGKPQAPVLTRLDTFLRSKLIRHMVGQPENRIDFSTLMDQDKIFLAKLSHGAIGEENAHLLGTLLVTAINQAAQRRQLIDRSQRQPYFLYIDEFQNFVTPTMESILSGSRKFNLALTLAHQDLRQLSSRDRDVSHSVLSNPCTRICFRCGDADAAVLARGFSSFYAEDLQSLGTGQAVVRIEQAQYDCNVDVDPPPSDLPESAQRIDRIVELVRERFATPKADVEEYLAQSFGRPAESPPRKAPPARDRRPEAPASTKPEDDRPAEAQRTASQVPPTDSRAPGRGGSHHRYLQSLVKKLALERGFHAEVEAPVLGRHGFVDVLLTKGEQRIACEISVSTPIEYELKNLEKCLAANIDQIVVLGHEKGKLRRLENVANEQMSADATKKIHFCLPEEFLVFLDTLAANTQQPSKTVRGYKVNVQYQKTTKAEQKQKQAAIAKLIVDSMRRMQS